MTTKTAKQKRTVLFASIPREVHDILRYISYEEKRSIADIAREAIDDFIKRWKAEKGKEK
jgi:hypothetical protein